MEDTDNIKFLQLLQRQRASLLKSKTMHSKKQAFLCPPQQSIAQILNRRKSRCPAKITQRRNEIDSLLELNLEDIENDVEIISTPPPTPVSLTAVENWINNRTSGLAQNVERNGQFSSSQVDTPLEEFVLTPSTSEPVLQMGPRRRENFWDDLTKTLKCQYRPELLRLGLGSTMDISSNDTEATTEWSPCYPQPILESHPPQPRSEFSFQPLSEGVMENSDFLTVAPPASVNDNTPFTSTRYTTGIQSSPLRLPSTLTITEVEQQDSDSQAEVQQNEEFGDGSYYGVDDNGCVYLEYEQEYVFEPVNTWSYSGLLDVPAPEVNTRHCIELRGSEEIGQVVPTSFENIPVDLQFENDFTENIGNTNSEEDQLISVVLIDDLVESAHSNICSVQ